MDGNEEATVGTVVQHNEIEGFSLLVVYTLTNSLEYDGSGDGFQGPPSMDRTNSPLKCLQWSWRTIAMIGGVTIGSAVLFRSLSASKLL